MLNIDISDDLIQFEKGIEDIYKTQIPFATKQAINDLIFDIKDQLTKEIFNVFEDVTPFTLQAIRVTKASKGNLTATVYISDSHDYLNKQVYGGVHKPNKHVLTVPFDIEGKAKSILKRGSNNLIRNKLKKIFQSSKRNEKSGNLWRMFFVGKPKGHKNAPEGIWERLPRNRRIGAPRRKRRKNGSTPRRSQKIKLVAIVKDTTKYDKRFEFNEIAEQEISFIFPKLFSKHFNKAIQTMKRVIRMKTKK